MDFEGIFSECFFLISSNLVVLFELMLKRFQILCKFLINSWQYLNSFITTLLLDRINLPIAVEPILSPLCMSNPSFSSISNLCHTLMIAPSYFMRVPTSLIGFPQISADILSKIFSTPLPVQSSECAHPRHNTTFVLKFPLRKKEHVRHTILLLEAHD